MCGPDTVGRDGPAPRREHGMHNLGFHIYSRDARGQSHLRIGLAIPVERRDGSVQQRDRPCSAAVRHHRLGHVPG